MPDEYTGICPRCGSPRWVSASFDEGWTRVPQCVPCGAAHPAVLGLGSNHPNYNREARRGAFSAPTSRASRDTGEAGR